MESGVSERAPPPSEAVRSIGWLMLNGVGDILCCTPTLDALRERYPAARIVAMVRPHLADLVASHAAVDAVLPFGGGSLSARLAYLQELRRQRFDLWFDVHTPVANTVGSNTRHFIRNLILMTWSGARFRRAYASSPLKPFLTHPLARPPAHVLAHLNIVDLTLPLAWPRPDRAYRKRLGVTEADRAWAYAQLPGEGVRIGLYFGTRQPANLWPAEHATRLARMVLENDPRATAVLIGDATDVMRARALIDSLPEALRARVSDFTGRAGFGASGALMERCTAIVTTDSGPMHMADALGVPLVTLFSSHNYPEVWRPVSAASVTIYHEIECGPCWLAECPIGNRCMARITPEEVYAALQGRLAAAGGPK